MRFKWEVWVDVSEQDAYAFAEDNSDAELADDYEPSYEDYEGAAQQMFDDDDFYYDFLGAT